MTYWAYTVHRKQTSNLHISAVAVADIRASYAVGSSEDDTVKKIIYIARNNGSPFPWGSAVVLVMGYPFWGNDNVKQQFISDLGSRRPSNAIDAISLSKEITTCFDFFSSCTLGVIVFNALTRQTTSCSVNISVSESVKRYSIDLPSTYLCERNYGFDFDYQESASMFNYFATKKGLLCPLQFGKDERSFMDNAIMSLGEVIREYSSIISNHTSLGHNRSVSPLFDVVIIHSNGFLEIREAPRRYGMFFSNAFNQAPTSQTVVAPPADLIDTENFLRGLTARYTM